MDNMKKLPKLPVVEPGIKYPPMMLEDRVSLVEKTDPQLYVDQIYLLLSEIDDYKDCLEHKGYEVTLMLKEGVKAVKTTTLTNKQSTWRNVNG